MSSSIEDMYKVFFSTKNLKFFSISDFSIGEPGKIFKLSRDPSFIECKTFNHNHKINLKGFYGWKVFCGEKNLKRTLGIKELPWQDP